jgi:hypothetical protein
MTEIREADKIHLHALGVRIDDGESILTWYVQHVKLQNETIDRLITEKQRLAMELQSKRWRWRFATCVLFAAVVFYAVQKFNGGNS